MRGAHGSERVAARGKCANEVAGEHALPLALDTYNDRITLWQQHQPLAASTQELELESA